ncbi:MAG: DUF1329 domain-containing protein [Proteobacteria bacterium]|nr:DUF1329 domain-containing protein [Pseudomonadota bacterium]
MTHHRRTLVHAAACGLLLAARLASAAVGADEAAKLKTTLTPLGAERAANKDGSIPAWDGGLTAVPGGARAGDVPVSLFANEKPVLQITAKNAAQYAEKLSDGTQALLAKFPQSFRIDVYPSHRTAAAPAWVYEATQRNATQCSFKDNAFDGCYGGPPFPIPGKGIEVMWNALMRVQGESYQMGFRNLVGTSDGPPTLNSRGENNLQFPYYYKDGSAEKWSKLIFMQRFATREPPVRAGESLVTHEQTQAREAWQYLVGQRRVRRAPSVGFDTPDFMSSGAHYFDEVFGFNGSPDRYEWKLLGKKELYIPYNNNRFVTAAPNEAFGRQHANPDLMRWELHRVWVLEATVAPGKRHAVPKRQVYIDEDSWTLALMDGYDSQNKLWRTTQVPTFAMPAIPAVLAIPSITYNLQAGTFSAPVSLNGETLRLVARKPDTFFTGDAAAADAAR